MKKNLALLAALVFLVGLPICYYWVGITAEDVLETKIARLREYYGLKIALKEKSRGLLSSSYRYTVNFDLPRPTQAGATVPQTISFDLHEVMHHGPIPFTSGTWTPALAVLDSGLEPHQAGQKAFHQFLETFPELRQSALRTTFGFSGDSRTTLTVPPTKRTITQPDGTAFAVLWQGLTAELDATANAEAFTLALDAPLLDVKGNTATVTLQGLSWTSKTTLHGQNLYLGNSAFSLTTLSVQNVAATAPSFALSNLALTGNSEQRGEVVDGAVSLRGESVDLKTQGKTTFEMAFSLKDLDFKTLDTLVEDFRRISLQRAAPEVQLQQLQVLLLRQGGALFSKGPRFTVETLALRLPSGTVEGSGFVAYSGTEALPASIPQALGRFTASVKAKASEAALLELFLASVKGDAALAGQTGRPQLEAVVQDLAEKGFVVREKGNLSATADWNGKALTVNGKPLFQMP